MKYGIILESGDRAIVNITSVHPEPVEVFVFRDRQDGRIEIYTESKSRLDQWERALNAQNRPYEVIPVGA